MSDQIKLNIQNGHSLSDSEKQERQQQYQPRREDNSVDVEPEAGSKKTGLFIFIVVLLIVATNVAMFLFVNNKNKIPSMKFIPESAIMTSTISPQNLENILTSNKTSPIFADVIAEIKEQSSELNINMQDALSYISQDALVAVIENAETKKTENIIIIQLPENSSFKQEIEDKIKRNFNVNYTTYRGESIINVSSLSFGEAKIGFSYAVVDNVLLVANNEGNVRVAVDAGR